MASKIKISRGDLSTKINKDPLVNGELFWEARHLDDNIDITEKYNEGTLWIGDPSLKGTADFLPIGGVRSVKSLVFKGELSSELNIQSPTFNHVRVGDFFIWKNDAVFDKEQDSRFFTEQYKKGDLLVITQIGMSPDDFTGNLNRDGTINNHQAIRYMRVMCSSGSAKGTIFSQPDGSYWPEWESNDVEGALMETQYEKLQWVCPIESQPLNPILGGLYLIATDQLIFNQGTDKVFTALRGNLVTYTRDHLYKDTANKTYATEHYWKLIPTGETNADRVKFYDESSLDKKEQFKTFLTSKKFSKNFVEEFDKNSSNVFNTLNFILARKAEVDENGIIPLDQLPSSLVGALYYRGTVDLSKVPDDNMTSREFTVYVNSLLKNGPLVDGNYVILTNSGEERLIYIDEVPFSVGDWALYRYENGFDIIERLNASSSVDNVNGKLAAVVIRGDGITGVNVNNAGQDIVLEAPTHLRGGVNKYIRPGNIPIIKEELSFEVVDSNIGIFNPGPYEPTVIKDYLKGTNISFPMISGQLVLKENGKGTENFLTKFDHEQKVVDSIVSEKERQITIHGEDGSGKDIRIDAKSETDIYLNENDDHGFFRLDPFRKSDVQGHISLEDDPATILTDISVIDCGEWL